jgi:hypothetical protein
MEGDMIKRCFILIGVVVIFSISVGCAGNQLSRLEMDYGTSFKLAIFNQVLDPDAEKNIDPVYGFDGKSGKITMERYWKGFEKPSNASFNINIKRGGR